MVSADELVRFHLETCERARDLVKKKGEDYSPNAEKDTLESLREQARWGFTKSNAHTALGFVVNKAKRIKSILDSGSANYESIDESIDDLINYAVYVKWFRWEDERKPKFVEEKSTDGLGLNNVGVFKNKGGSLTVGEAGRINMNDKSEKERDVELGEDRYSML